MSFTREINQLTPVPTLDTTAIFEIEQGGNTFKTNLADMLALQTTNLLSNLIIDTDKDWLGFEITNLVLNAANNTITNIGFGEVIPSIITGFAAIADVAVDDELLIHDTSAGALRRVDVSDLIQVLIMNNYADKDPADDEFLAVVGERDGQNNEIERQTPVPEACLLRKMSLFVNANGENSATDWNFRINGANGNQTISIPAATTGFFRDVTNTDTVAVGDLINYQITNLTDENIFLGGSSMVATVFS
jgi:hypothetical protein